MIYGKESGEEMASGETGEEMPEEDLTPETMPKPNKMQPDTKGRLKLRERE